MNLKKLFKKGYLDFNKMIVDNFMHFNLTKDELLFLIKLHEMDLKDLNVIDFSKFDSENNFKKKSEQMFLALLEKNVVTLFPDREDFSLDSFYQKLFDFIMNLDKPLGLVVVEKLEKALCRTLSKNEIEIVSEWFNEKEVNLELVRKVINLSKKQDNLSFNYINGLIKAQLSLDTKKEEVDLEDLIEQAIGKDR